MIDPWKYEGELFADGWKVICGVDEAGRGPLAGPVYAAAVILPFGTVLPGLDDSKKLTEKKREELYLRIIDAALCYGIAGASVREIDELNILNATYLAMNRAIGKLDTIPEIAVIDGNMAKGVAYPHLCVVGGDGKSEQVAAASVLAKVSRDRYMKRLAERYPQYRFDKHKGYGTALHYERLREYGVSEAHRRTFLKKLGITDG